MPNTVEPLLFKVEGNGTFSLNYRDCELWVEICAIQLLETSKAL